MKALLPILVLMVGFSASVTSVQAQDTMTEKGAGAQTADYHPGGGWDLNNLRVSVTKSKLLKADYIPRGGWDGNNLRVSVSPSRLLKGV